MNREEHILVNTLRILKSVEQENKNLLAVLLQRHLAENGQLSEEAGAKVRELLKD